MLLQYPAAVIVLRCLQAVYGFLDGESDGEEGWLSQLMLLFVEARCHLARL